MLITAALIHLLLVIIAFGLCQEIEETSNFTKICSVIPGLNMIVISHALRSILCS